MEKKDKLKTASIDAETVGLWGKPFSIAVVLYSKEGKKEEEFTIRRELSEEEKDFAKTQVFKNESGEITFSLPDCIEQSNDIKNAADSYEKMIEEFSKFYLKHRENYTTLWYMGHVVETFLFRECVKLGFIGVFEAPYTPIELSEHLRLNFHTISVDKFIEENKIEIGEKNTHHPLYDAEAAAKVYYNI